MVIPHGFIHEVYTETMAKQPYLTVKNGTYYFRISAPRQIRGKIHRDELIYSLRTKCKYEAKARCVSLLIPGRKNRIVKIAYDKSLYNHRKYIEILFGTLKENKRIDTRFDKYDHARTRLAGVVPIRHPERLLKRLVFQ